MAYSELIKSFERIRDYMREFYVYGFKSRTEYEKKSPRSYDNERRRIESYLADYMGFRQTPSGKNVFLSIDSRKAPHNPLYKVFKAKSFTDGDITLHFILFDILYAPEIALSLQQIMEKMDNEYLSVFQVPKLFDESTVRKKLKEYVSLGLIESEKQGKQMLYHRSGAANLDAWTDAFAFYSETAPLGVVGSFLLDKQKEKREYYSFKHHYITHALESEVLCHLFEAISERRKVKLRYHIRQRSELKETELIPLKVFISVQNGRQYICGYQEKLGRFKFHRLDYISSVHIGEATERFKEMREKLSEKQRHMWGVTIKSGDTLEHVEFTVHVGAGEEYIVRRLEREKRCGTVEQVDENTYRFKADVYDMSELIPWIRTFLCRITSLRFSNQEAEEQFRQDVHQMYGLYRIGEETDDIS